MLLQLSFHDSRGCLLIPCNWQWVFYLLIETLQQSDFTPSDGKWVVAGDITPILHSAILILRQDSTGVWITKNIKYQQSTR